jgi:hypothetical protein
MCVDVVITTAVVDAVEAVVVATPPGVVVIVLAPILVLPVFVGMIEEETLETIPLLTVVVGVIVAIFEDACGVVVVTWGAAPMVVVTLAAILELGTWELLGFIEDALVITISDMANVDKVGWSVLDVTVVAALLVAVLAVVVSVIPVLTPCVVREMEDCGGLVFIIDVIKLIDVEDGEPWLVVAFAVEVVVTVVVVVAGAAVVIFIVVSVMKAVKEVEVVVEVAVEGAVVVVIAVVEVVVIVVVVTVVVSVVVLVMVVVVALLIHIRSDVAVGLAYSTSPKPQGDE